MSSRTRIALGLASGYLLGRYRKTRWIAAVAAAVAARQLGGAAARQGARAVAGSPELRELGDRGREVAVTVLSQQLHGLTSKLHARTEALRQPLRQDGGGQPSAEHPEQPERPEQPEQPEQPERPEQRDQPEQRGQPERSERPEQDGRRRPAADREGGQVGGRPTSRGRR